MATTLLQMVNRVRKEGRHDVVVSVDTAGDELTSALVDIINVAKRDILEGQEWDFDKRHDGILKVAKKREYSTFLMQNDSTQALAVTETDYASYADGSAVAKLVISDDANYGNEAFRIVTADTTAGSDDYTLELRWPGTAGVTLSGFVFADEYVLPSTVKDVLSVRDEDGDLDLEFVDREVDFYPRVPAPNRVGATRPELVTVGATLTPTANGFTGATVTPGLGMLIYPVPSEDYILRYSYRYRHPDLAATTDTLSNVHERVVDEIIGVAKELAFSNHIFNDPTLARLHMERNEQSQKRAKRTDNPQPMRRMRFGTHTSANNPSYGSKAEDDDVFYQP